jgi:cell division septum initiation protein DivIVA
MDFGLKFIRKLKPCNWRYKPPMDDGVRHTGFVAQDVDELVSHKEYGFVVMKEGYMHLSLQEFIGPLVKAVQELADENDDLRQRVKSLELKKNITSQRR